MIGCFLSLLVLSVSLASSPGHKIKYKTLKGKYVEEEVSSATYDILPEGYDESLLADPWAIDSSTSWSEWPTKPEKPQLRINSDEVEKESSSSDENDILLTGSRLSCVLGSKAALSGISLVLLIGTLYWRDLLCRDEKEFGMLGAWISLIVLALTEEAISIVDLSLIASRYFHVSGATPVLLRIMSVLGLLLPLAEIVGLLFIQGPDGPVGELCNTSAASPFEQWKWIGLEIAPAGLIFLLTLSMLKANNAVMVQNSGSIVIYDKLP